ncbi:MAG: insulinase family protein [Polyangiaceae bacterium]|nr:insulinase family protein [Polyangiaceae bacterium]
MMQDGSSFSSGFRFNEDLDRIRAVLDVTAKHDLFELQVTLPSAAVVEGTSLAASILQTPSLDPERFTHRKAQLRTFYEDWSTRVRNTMLNREVERALLGDEHRYVRAAGDAKTLEELDFQVSVSAYTQVLQPDNTLVAAAGACGPGLDQALARTIGLWKQTAHDEPRKAPPSMRVVPRSLLLFNEPAARSSNFRWGLTLPSMESEEWVHALVAREVLSVRLRHRFEFERRLTDDFGLARVDSLAGSWLELWGSSEAGVTGDVLLAFSRELDAMSTLPSQEELESAQRRVVFDLVSAAQSPKWMSSRILDWMMHGVLARAATFERIVMAVTADQVAAVGRNYLSAARGALIVMGPRDAVKPKLAELGWGRVIDGGTVGVSTTSAR